MNDENTTTTIDQAIVRSIREVRRFFGQVGLMLSKADELMQRRGWRNALTTKPSACIANTKRSLQEPERWLPEYACRMFVHPQNPRLLAFVAVIFDSSDELDHAIASAGWYEFSKDTAATDWRFWFMNAHLWARDRTDDGKLCPWDPSVWRERELVFVRSVHSFAYLLSSITGEELLESLITGRLIEEISIASHDETR